MTAFACPNCGKVLEAPGDGSATVHCDFCDHEVVVPAEAGTDNRSRSAQAAIQAQISALVQHGKKIEAIKMYREIYQADLVTAKNAVETLERGEALPASPADPAQVGGAALGDLKEIARLVRADQKIEAIKLYRHMTGVGLKEAKDAVEALARGEPVQISSTTFTTTTATGGEQLGAQQMAEVVRLVQAGQKIEAIKIFRQSTSLGLKEAKDAVEALERGLAGQGSSTESFSNTTHVSPTTSFSSGAEPAMPGTEPDRTGGGRKAVWLLGVVIILLIAGIALAIAYQNGMIPK